MGDRLPPVARDALSRDEQKTYDSLEHTSEVMFGSPDKSPFIMKRSDGALVGPFPFFFAAPEAGEYLMALFPKLGKIPGLPADAKEVAILTVGAKYKAAYELYAHTNVAHKKVGMKKEVVDSLERGEKPDGLSEAAGLAWDTTDYLVKTPGPLSMQLWERCLDTFGKEGTVALVHYIGSYAYLSIALNAMDAPVPKEGE